MAEPRDSLSDQHKHILSRLDVIPSAIDGIHDTLERKVQFNFALMSTAATILAAANVTTLDASGTDDQILCIILSFFIVFGISYLLVAICTVYVLRPRDRTVLSLKPTNHYLNKWRGLDAQDYFKFTLSTYRDIWQLHTSNMPKKNCAVLFSYIFASVGFVAAIIEAALIIWVKLNLT